jgi:hypothetical protein
MFELHDVSFGACNTLPREGETLLDVGILDPQRDRRKLESLLESRPDIWRDLACQHLTFGRPSEMKLYIARGEQGGMVKEWDRVAQEEIPDRVPIDVLGLVRRSRTPEILRRKPEFVPIDEPLKVHLVPGEVRHFVVRGEQKDLKARSAFLLQIDHWLEFERKHYIGGLSFLLIPPYNPFRAERPKSYPPAKSK